VGPGLFNPEPVITPEMSLQFAPSYSLPENSIQPQNYSFNNDFVQPDLVYFSGSPVGPYTGIDSIPAGPSNIGQDLAVFDSIPQPVLQMEQPSLAANNFNLNQNTPQGLSLSDNANADFKSVYNTEWNSYATTFTLGPPTPTDIVRAAAPLANSDPFNGVYNHIRVEYVKNHPEFACSEDSEIMSKAPLPNSETLKMFADAIVYERSKNDNVIGLETNSFLNAMYIMARNKNESVIDYLADRSNPFVIDIANSYPNGEGFNQIGEGLFIMGAGRLGNPNAVAYNYRYFPDSGSTEYFREDVTKEAYRKGTNDVVYERINNVLSNVDPSLSDLRDSLSNTFSAARGIGISNPMLPHPSDLPVFIDTRLGDYHPQDSDKSMVVIDPIADWNGGFVSRIKASGDEGRIFYYQAGDAKEAAKLFADALVSGAPTIVFGGHGTGESIRHGFNARDDVTYLYSKELDNAVAKAGIPDVQREIFLASCSTGEGKEDSENMANNIANILDNNGVKFTINAPTVPASIDVGPVIGSTNVKISPRAGGEIYKVDNQTIGDIRDQPANDKWLIFNKD